MEWVNAHNERSMKAFEADPHWQAFVDEALALASNPDRLAVPALRGNEVYYWLLRERHYPRRLE